MQTLRTSIDYPGRITPNTRYDARGRLGGHRTEEHTETLQLSSTNDISLHIEGDLNDAECADIQQALDTFEQFATDFFNGEVDEPPNQVFDLDDLNTLHSIDTTLEFSQSLSVSQQTETRVANAAHLGLEPNTAALEAQPSITQHPKDLLRGYPETMLGKTVFLLDS